MNILMFLIDIFLIFAMKIAFQNVRHINNDKTARIYNYLTKGFDIFCLSEFDPPRNYSVVNSDLFQYHIPEETPRLAVYAVNTAKISPVGPGFIIKGPKKDHNGREFEATFCQSYIYEIELHNRKLHVENFYLLPPVSTDTVEKVRDHLDFQSFKYDNYLAGGDFNLNFKEKTIRDKFKKHSSYNQIIKKPTRIGPVMKKNRETGVMEYFEKNETIIDLIFENNGASKLRTKFGLKDLKSAKANFDHKCVYAEIGPPNLKYYTTVKDIKSPLERPIPNENQTEKIGKLIGEIPEEYKSNYDLYMIKLAHVLDKVIPLRKYDKNKTKKLYRTPISKELEKEISHKKHLYRFRKRSEEDRKKYRIQCNKVKQ